MTDTPPPRDLRTAAQALVDALDAKAKADAYNGDHARRRQERAADDALGAWATLRAALAAEATEPPPRLNAGERMTVTALLERVESWVASVEGTPAPWALLGDMADFLRRLASGSAPNPQGADEPKRWTFDVHYEGGPQPTDYGTGTEWDGGWQWAIYDGPHELHDAVLSGWAPEDPTPVLAGLVAEHNRAADATPSPLKPRGFGPNFHWAAAPQALEHHVATYRARVTRLSRELAWLENLLTERNGQVARGEWPPTTQEGSR